jgi:KDO2-lipid IV(A) lauroyltransferase
MLQFTLYKVLIFIIHLLGRRNAYAFARFCAGQHYRMSEKDRRSVINNLRHIMRTREDVSEPARRVFHNFAQYLVDFFLMYRIVDDRFVQENVSIQGRDNFDQAYARGKGVIILTAHIGNWEMGAAIMNRLGHPLTAIALPHKNKKVNKLFNRQRENHGVKVVPTSTAVRRCLETLRKNGCVAVLGDRDFGSFGEPLLFFGRPTLIPKGAAFFALRTGAAIVPSFLVPSVDGKYVLTFEEPIYSPAVRSGDDHVDEVALMKQYITVIENRVRENPTQWLMFREFGIEYEDLSTDTRVQRSTSARSAR